MDNQAQREAAELKETLEYQIDIVLRLEEERLLLLKENKLQKQKITELSNMLNKYTIQQESLLNKPAKINQDEAVQVSIVVENKFYGIDTQTQTDIAGLQYLNDLAHQQFEHSTKQNESRLKNSDQKYQLQNVDNQDSLIENDSLLQYSREESVFEQAQSLLQKHNENEKTNTTTSKKSDLSLTKKSQISQKNRLPVKELHFKKKDNKENSQMNDQSNLDISSTQDLKKPKQKSEQEIIAEELVKLTKEYNLIKKEQVKQNDIMKKKEKEIQDFKKQVEVKNEMLDKLRQEVAELSIIINNDKFKSIRTIEQDLQKYKSQYQQVSQECQQRTKEKEALDLELKQFKSILEKLTQQYEKMQNSEGGDQYLKNEVSQLKQKVEDLNRKLNLKNEEIVLKHKSLEEMKQEYEKLNMDVDYFKSISQSSRQHAEKAIKDVEFYRNLLKQYNVPLQ